MQVVILPYFSSEIFVSGLLLCSVIVVIYFNEDFHYHDAKFSLFAVFVNLDYKTCLTPCFNLFNNVYLT